MKINISNLEVFEDGSETFQVHFPKNKEKKNKKQRKFDEKVDKCFDLLTEYDENLRKGNKNADKEFLLSFNESFPNSQIEDTEE